MQRTILYRKPSACTSKWTRSNERVTRQKKTLRTLAKYGDQWNAGGTVETLTHKDAVLRRHCADVGRDPETIERTVNCKIVIRDTAEAARRAWGEQMAANRTPMEDVSDDVTWFVGTPEQVAETMAGYLTIGFRAFISEHPAPYDIESIERLVGEVKPMVEAG